MQCVDRDLLAVLGSKGFLREKGEGGRPSMLDMSNKQGSGTEKGEERKKIHSRDSIAKMAGLGSF